MPLAIDHNTRIPSGIAPLNVGTGTSPPLLSEAGQQDAGTENLITGDVDIVTKVWTIYVLTHLLDGRIYVGLTQRLLIERMRSHLFQAKRDRRIRPGGLMEAIQAALAQGKTFAETFTVEVVAIAQSKAEAMALERHWVERLGSRHPNGLNGMPGGSSVGGVDNARPLAIKLPDGATRSFATIQEAIAWSGRRLRAEGRPLIDPGTVYARLAMNWPSEQALGLTPHRDGRRLREAFTMDGKCYRTLAEASAASGICIDSLRSRLHRQRVSGVHMDLSVDRRRSGSPRVPRLRREAVAETRPPTDRRKLVVIVLPCGKRLVGGEREVIGKVLADPVQEARRATRLSLSGIRRRLRLIDDYDRLLGGQAVLWAFGFTEATPDGIGTPAKPH